MVQSDLGKLENKVRLIQKDYLEEIDCMDCSELAEIAKFILGIGTIKTIFRKGDMYFFTPYDIKPMPYQYHTILSFTKNKVEYIIDLTRDSRRTNLIVPIQQFYRELAEVNKVDIDCFVIGRNNLVNGETGNINIDNFNSLNTCEITNLFGE